MTQLFWTALRQYNLNLLPSTHLNNVEFRNGQSQCPHPDWTSQSLWRTGDHPFLDLTPRASDLMRTCISNKFLHNTRLLCLGANFKDAGGWWVRKEMHSVQKLPEEC